MKKYIISVLFLLIVQQTFAASFYEQLCAFNFNWEKYKTQAPPGDERKFNSDKELVSAHLTNVLIILRDARVAQLDLTQLNSRKHLIHLLESYCMAGNYPVNYYIHHRIPVFIDEHKTHCAVAYLLQQTGQEEMALRIATTNNYAWLKDIQDTRFSEWQQASGLAMEELKLIQGAYDHYRSDALTVWNRYEVPQKPACTTTYFRDNPWYVSTTKNKKIIWCKGEGVNGVLHGSWIQNFGEDMPWITGFFENGKRSGQWQEFYQGTKQLCRTENWRNDELNGIRKRYDRSGKLIEEILFKNGKAIVKTNYDLDNSLIWIRKPLDSTLVWTEVYTSGGGIIAAGHERIYNPGNLLWFQNIELTALNSSHITSRNTVSSDSRSNFALYNTPPLVQYRKEGEWIYYKEYPMNKIKQKTSDPIKDMFTNNYRHFGSSLYQSVMVIDGLKMNAAPDSIHATYTDDNMQNFYGYYKSTFTHLQIRYYDITSLGQEIDLIYPGRYRFPLALMQPRAVISECGQYNMANKRIGVWKHYDTSGQLYKTESYIVLRRKEDLLNN